ncbi:non-canonical purine NTP pyrophosphatase [Kroppenstedtia eburnea]|uniref:DITPase n=1 Tax=Kroppenstedtia eburnea TaxID=714067 RepID=A0A1N7JWM7_9BACL|nr:non-canonical purine NTP pyrophosphatase [Kroppenstedtia eburnea]QKI83409.1 non-canonical purine NTP pyrophosphatase [Kroppenstedtia eburnea]SIS53604.1 dITPase [Kroppenstedtia eburnea]
MILPFATQNKGKLTGARQVLEPLGIRVDPLPLDLAEPDFGSVEEVTGEKLRQVRALGYDRVMVDDAGIFFSAYDGFPGILSKRVFQRIGYKGVMKLLEGESREAWFEGAVAVLWDGETAFFSGKTPGHLLRVDPANITPEPDFPFNPIFVPRGDDRTLSQMSPRERKRYSYRGKALEELASWLKRRFDIDGHLSRC